jgi:malonyl-ACP decarboxylase
MDTLSTRVMITGMGIVCSIAQTVQEFVEAIREGRSGITKLPEQYNHSVRIGAWIKDFSWQNWLNKLSDLDPAIHRRACKILNNTTDSTRLSACGAIQAFQNAHSAGMNKTPDELGIIVAGSNLAQSYTVENWKRFSESGRMNPRYALSFFDSNQVGCLSEILAIRGPGLTIGAAAASSNAALFQAFHWIRCGLVKRCLVVGAAMEFSPMELEAFAILGAASCNQFAGDPDRACRPFDQAHEGFVWGQGSASVMLESAQWRGGLPAIGEISGVSLLLDGNHLPDPSADGEARAMRAALESAKLEPDRIGYINAHGSSSALGDRTECAAIKAVFQESISNIWINSTKSLTGHCFSASGTIELIATILQLNGGFVHPNRNLDNPIDLELKLAGNQAGPLSAQYALTNGFGFGGINSSLVVKGNNA